VEVGGGAVRWQRCLSRPALEAREGASPRRVPLLLWGDALSGWACCVTSPASPATAAVVGWLRWWRSAFSLGVYGSSSPAACGGWLRRPVQNSRCRASLPCFAHRLCIAIAAAAVALFGVLVGIWRMKLLDRISFL
jgi:hypothetical protein